MKEIVLLTGGTGSIGSALLESLPAAGHKVYFTSRSAEKIAATESKINAALPAELQVKGIAVDLTQGNYIETIENFFVQENQFPTALINNARNLETLKVTNGSTQRVHFAGELELGVLVPYELSMALAGKGLHTIINIASMYGVVPPNRNLYMDGYDNSPIQYGVAKAALIHLTKELAVRFSDKQIRVNSISYGGVAGRANEEFMKRYAGMTPMGRMLQQSEVSGPVKFLLSEDSSGMTGHNLLFDGGYTLW